MYIANGSTLNRVDPNSGATQSTVNVTLNGSALTLEGIDFAPDGTLYGVGLQALFQIDVSSGVATRITPVGQNAVGTLIMTEMDFGADNIIRAVTFDTDRPLWAIDPTTGLGTSIFSLAPSGSPYSSVASFNVIPEPSAAVLGGALLGLLGFMRRRRKLPRQAMK